MMKRIGKKSGLITSRRHAKSEVVLKQKVKMGQRKALNRAAYS
jgi:hypothetical protein